MANNLHESLLTSSMGTNYGSGKIKIGNDVQLSSDERHLFMKQILGLRRTCAREVSEIFCRISHIQTL